MSKTIYTTHWPDGSTAIIYHENNIRHRADGPAYIRYNKNGNIEYMAYFVRGKRIDNGCFIPLRPNKKLNSKSHNIGL